MTTRPQKGHWRPDDLVAKASVDELTNSWLVDETGEIDEGAATDTWTADCLGGGGALQAELEAKRWTVCSHTEWSRIRNARMR